MPRSVALISLYPINGIGGGERYTFGTYHSIKAAGDHCVLFARTDGGPDTQSLHQRLQIRFTEFAGENRPLRSISFKDILMMLGSFEIVWIHQFLSADLIFDVIATVNSAQKMLMTNLGHEPLASRFAAFYCQPKNHYFIEISRYAAQRSCSFGRQSLAVTGAIWRSEFARRSTYPLEHEWRKICSVGRVLPHKGVDITIKALPAGWVLDLVGPLGDSEYVAHLRLLAKGHRVHFAGAISEEQKNQTVTGSTALVASSCHQLYDGRTIPQAELLGLVIFEAITLNVLPVTSDIPSFKEVMGELGLSRCIYAAGDVERLAYLLNYVSSLALDERRTLIENAATVVERQYLWDDYWRRVGAAIEREEI